jgi:hypothetical protein
MRIHRRFQPMFDSMPSRIAPSSVAILPVPVPVPVSVSSAVSIADDSDPPETTGSTPVILAPTQAPTTLPC